MGKNNVNKHWNNAKPYFDNCILYDDRLNFIGEDVAEIFEDIDDAWQKLYCLLNVVIDTWNNIEIQDELYTVGGEILKWVSRKDSFAVSILLSLHPHFMADFVFIGDGGERVPKDVRVLVETLTKTYMEA